MWFTGGTGSVAGTTQGIGYATLPCPPLPDPLLPPTDFIGIIKKNKFFNKTECVLESTWNPSPSSNVVSYRIYHNGVAVDTIPATTTLIYVTCLKHCSAKGYQIAAVSSDNVESSRVNLRIIHE